MPVQQRLQHGHHIVLGHPLGSLQHDCLVELADIAAEPVQPTDDRGRDHGPGARVDHGGFPVGEYGDLSQPRHRLLHKDVARSQQQSGSPGTGHHLHGRNAVSAQIKERVIHTDLLDAEHLRVDTRQDLLDCILGRAVMIGILELRRGERTGIELAVDGKRQSIQHHHGGRNHIGRQTLRQGGSHCRGIQSARR
ncbi:Uncharacterised protein [Mycobacteroides abscessus subsp. abscessus]|nr:Uncharacterised protein [Mycobacteroides abscessus subsp. abscessus]